MVLEGSENEEEFYEDDGILEDEIINLTCSNRFFRIKSFNF